MMLHGASVVPSVVFIKGFPWRVHAVSMALSFLPPRCFHGCVCPSMVVSWASMVLPWRFRGAFMVLPARFHRVSIVLHGTSTVLPWFMIMVHAYSFCFHRTFMDSRGVPWCFHGVLILVSWVFCDASMVCSLLFRGAFIDSVCVDGASMVLSRTSVEVWSFHGVAMARSWPLMVCVRCASVERS